MSVSVRLRTHSAGLRRRTEDDGAAIRSPWREFSQTVIGDLAADHHTGHTEFGGQVVHPSTPTTAASRSYSNNLSAGARNSAAGAGENA